jgi:tetratricopeptide (TPR) repeat protein
LSLHVVLSLFSGLLIAPLVDAAGLDATGRAALADLVRALAVHAENFFDVEVPKNDLERHRITDEECDLLARALWAAPDHPQVMNQVRRFIALAQMVREYQRMDRVLLPALEAHPDDVGLRYVSGKANYEMQAFDLAVEDLEVVVRSDRMRFEAFLLLGLSYAKLAEPDHAAAIAALESARDLRPGSLDVLRELGIVLCEAGRLDEARPLLERVAAEVPGDAEVRARLERIRSR